MHLLLTDDLCCPRCGPAFGLILLAEELSERRLLRGTLGCANCRERYPVSDGFADLRPPPAGPPEESGELPEGDAEEAFRLAALLGIGEGPAVLLLLGEPAGQSERIASLLEGVEVVGAHAALSGLPEVPGVSRVITGLPLPFRGGTLAGIACQGKRSAGELEEAVRTLRPGGRIVWRHPPDGAAERLEGLGLELLLQTGKAVVASLA
ncbi:MAG: hypothetical protein WD960_15240 [Gemmatimonadota bacterium]